MRTFADNRNTKRVDFGTDRFRDLVGHALLQLQAARKDVDQPRDLTEADDTSVRDIRDVALAEKWKQVVFAQAVKVDVPHDDHLAIIHAEQGAVEHLIDVSAIATREKFQRRLDSLWGPYQPFARRIFA